MANDFTKLPKQIILDQVNADNPSLGLTDALVTFGLPTANGTAAAGDTQLTLTAVNGSGYTGTRDVFYNRIGIAVVPGSRSKIFQKGDATKIADLIPEINSRYGINLTADDFTDGDLPPFEGEPLETHDFVLTISANSLVFTGTVTLTVKIDDIPLADAIVNNELTGLVWVPV